MKITIDPYDLTSISKAIKQIKEYQKLIKKREKQLVEKLAMLGAYSATVYFSRALYAGTNDVQVNVQLDGNTAHIIASGESVAFIEFGTGVKYGEGYLGKKPQGISGIGEYGHNRGKSSKGWFYPLENGLGTNGAIAHIKPNLAHTYGNSPNMAMYKSIIDIQAQVEQVAREVFNDR